MTLGTLNLGNYGIIVYQGHAGFSYHLYHLRGKVERLRWVQATVKTQRAKLPKQRAFRIMCMDFATYLSGRTQALAHLLTCTDGSTEADLVRYSSGTRHLGQKTQTCEGVR